MSFFDYKKAYWLYESAVADGTCSWNAYFTGDIGIMYPNSDIEQFVCGVHMLPKIEQIDIQVSIAC